MSVRTNQHLIVTGLLLLLSALQPPIYAAEFDYPLKPITDKIQVIFGPVELPDSSNRGFRNNVIVVRTSKGIVLMDPGGSAWSGEMVARKVKSMHGAPVVAVFNSHAHGDHWLGNEGIKRHFPDAIIYGHPKMKARLEHSDGITWLETINRVTDNLADGKQVIAPDRTVNDGDVITVGDTGFRIIHTGNGHTDNDIMIEVIGEDALFTGDVVRDHFLGLMEDDASFKGNIEAIDNIAGLNFKHYIPGHGNVGGVETPLSYRAYLKSLRDMVAELFDEGVESYEMKPRIVEALSDYRDWPGFELRLGGHISRAYLEVEQEEFE
ncbi:MAG: MBL fold metallo-hydrolase [Gammaproteobacteria bacterium]|nr:MBL fold metallo-hydrolase [Gammaproteobacteria bacterium]